MCVWSLLTERARRSTWSLTCTVRFSSHCVRTQERSVLCTPMSGQEQLCGITELTSIQTCFITGSRPHGWKMSVKSPDSGTVFSKMIRTQQVSKIRTKKSPAGTVTVFSLGLLLVDFQGRASFPTIAPGKYWVVGFTRTRGGCAVWNLPILLKPGENSVILDQKNAVEAS